MKSARIVAVVGVLAVSLAAVCMSCYSMGLANAAPVVAPKADAGRSKITCEELVIKSKDGKHSIVLFALDDGVTINVHGPGKQFVQIASLKGYDGPYIGIHGGKQCNWSVALDHKGNPFLQTTVDGVVKHTPVKP